MRLFSQGKKSGQLGVKNDCQNECQNEIKMI